MSHLNEQILKCQNCHLPLQIDTSLLDLSIAQRNLLINSHGNQYTFKPSGFKIPNVRLQRLNKVKDLKDIKFKNPLFADSFVVLKNENLQDSLDVGKYIESSTSIDSESGIKDTRLLNSLKIGDASGDYVSLSAQVSSLTKIFNILSENSNFDHPICQECCNIIIEKMQGQFDEVLKERDTYQQFIKQIEEQKGNFQETSLTEKETEFKTLLDEREILLKHLQELEKKDEQLDKDIGLIQEMFEGKKVKTEEIMLRNNNKDLDKLRFEKELRSLNCQYESLLHNLDQLRKLNVYNETFKISHEGPFGTINGLRLGGFDDVPVSWKEINAALGQVILLLYTISTRLDLKLDGYKFQPLGSFSKIMKFNKETEDWLIFEAYSDESFKVGKIFRRESNFDKAMECLLATIRQLVVKLATLKKVDNNVDNNSTSEQDELELPYSIYGDKINSLSVKLYGSNPTLEWTTAMKLLLTNIKWLLAYASSKLN
ncbi:hypothetical protein TPHA_0A01060 [Tetrapisispora phaffii CBS 4417]|uniref:Uncharacterized protein n=1 Tax=Tetrapisispora phaffii (strain ATCC 24235 / CBS 4417 / NBRC 1672 / NRRL Y-8282 / UCD 70-5) TaxID=1071381 RepID=G8BMR3_TETPH|nr:hypothetical protein TPHA_0A01060 [Tetrapisispora phaffii CBS 4417]CCE61191.1 hypothetical protein TPHA_0A01060 [Tetrapisispora phaffii CBS 4417]